MVFYRRFLKVINQTGIFFLIMVSGLFGTSGANPITSNLVFVQGEKNSSEGPYPLYLPIISNVRVTNRVNVPFFDSNIDFNKTAIFWFGKVTPDEDYTDVRMGYSQTELYIRLAIFDRLIWYNLVPTLADLTNWDSVSLYLNLDGTKGFGPSLNTFRFDSQINDWEPSRLPWQGAYHGDGVGWTPLSNNIFTTWSGYRWESDTIGGINNGQNNRGWEVGFSIPFSSLGLTSAPTQNTIWGMGIVIHNRNSQSGPLNPDKFWPELMSPTNPYTWGDLNFGIPTYSSRTYTNPQKSTIRQGLDGVTVVDGMVGGSSVCGEGLDVWNGWGNKNYTGSGFLVEQNQSDIADWPCYSKIYITFPLSTIPLGKVIVSAKLTLYQFGNSDPSQAKPSFIQIMSVAQDWKTDQLTWNNAPLASQNYGGAWVDPLLAYPGDSGVARNWDVTRALYDAYSIGAPLRLVLYSADSDYHSGKYFLSSSIGDWNKASRPTLDVTWGDPVP